jgi:hypothetical protein
MGPSDHVRDWLKKLGTLISPAMTQQEFAGRINVLAPELVQEFPPDAFTQETARLVARQCKFFPNFAEICTALEPWAKEQRTAKEYAALPPPREQSTEPYDPGPAPDWCFDRGVTKAGTIRPTALPLTRGQLTEAYRQAGIKGPQVSASDA